MEWAKTQYIKKDSKCSNIKKQYLTIFNFDYNTEEYMQGNNPNRPQVPDHPCKMLLIGCSGSGKTNALLNLIIH